MKTLLITGATGFVGRNLILREIARGTQILAPVRSAAKLRAQLESEGVDPRAVTALDADPAQWVGGVQPTHALLSAGVLFARDREEYFATNVDWTLRVLEALPESTRIVVLSSQSAGGPTPPGRAARTESDADTPLTWYGKSKLALERALQSQKARRLCILRPPMILGPRDTATLPLFKMAMGLVRTKPGLRRKEFSFISVEDVVEAVEAAWNCESTGPHYISAHRTITDWELIGTAARAAGGKSRPAPIRAQPYPRPRQGNLGRPLGRGLHRVPPRHRLAKPPRSRRSSRRRFPALCPRGPFFPAGKVLMPSAVGCPIGGS
jgi:nucleoside-diphosphate-sugar epimerase